MNLVRNALSKAFEFPIQQYGMLLGFGFFFFSLPPNIFSCCVLFIEILHFHVRAVHFRFYDIDTIIDFMF